MNNGPDIKDPMDVFPEELGVKIMSFLPLSALVNAQQVSQKWKRISDTDYLWKQKGNEILPLNFRSNPPTSKENLKAAFAAECEKMKTDYPEETVNAFGPNGARKIAALPILDLADTLNDYIAELPILDLGDKLHNYLDFVQAKEMQGAEIKRGQDITGQRPFLTLCAQNNSSDHKKTLVQTFSSQFYKDNKKLRAYGDNCIIPNTELNETHYEYLGRLIRHEPCGVVTSRGEGPRTLEDGRSVIELTDQREFQQPNQKVASSREETLESSVKKPKLS